MRDFLLDRCEKGAVAWVHAAGKHKLLPHHDAQLRICTCVSMHMDVRNALISKPDQRQRRIHHPDSNRRPTHVTSSNWLRRRWPAVRSARRVPIGRGMPSLERNLRPSVIEVRPVCMKNTNARASMRQERVYANAYNHMRTHRLTPACTQQTHH